MFIVDPFFIHRLYKDVLVHILCRKKMNIITILAWQCCPCCLIVIELLLENWGTTRKWVTIDLNTNNIVYKYRFDPNISEVLCKNQNEAS